MNAKNIALSSLAAFLICVVALSTFGKDWLRTLDTHDSTVDLVDLARQAAQQRKYDEAEEFYKEALTFARKSDNTGDDEAFVLVSYAEFVRNKRKNKVRAEELDAEARKVRLAHAELAGEAQTETSELNR